MEKGRYLHDFKEASFRPSSIGADSSEVGSGRESAERTCDERGGGRSSHSLGRQSDRRFSLSSPPPPPPPPPPSSSSVT